MLDEQHVIEILILNIESDYEFNSLRIIDFMNYGLIFVHYLHTYNCQKNFPKYEHWDMKNPLIKSIRKIDRTKVFLRQQYQLILMSDVTQCTMVNYNYINCYVVN